MNEQRYSQKEHVIYNVKENCEELKIEKPHHIFYRIKMPRNKLEINENKNELEKQFHPKTI